MAIKFFGVSKCREQLLQLLVFNGCQMAVRIHRQDQKIEKCPVLGGGEPSEVNVHVKRLPEVEDDFKAIQESIGLESYKCRHADRLRDGRDQCVWCGYRKYVKRACEMTDTDMLRLVNAVQGIGLAVAWHEINSQRIEEPAHVRSSPEWMANYQPRSQARHHPDASIDE